MGGFVRVLDGQVNRGGKQSFAVLGALLFVVFGPNGRPAGGRRLSGVRGSAAGAAPSP